MVIASAGTATAQSWTGFYAGASAGAGFLRDRAETVAFDTNLDGTFSDTVRTAAGVDAFSPGFCAGLAVAAAAASGCTGDDKGFEFGARAGYDWQAGRLVLGALVDVSRADLTDSVTAFSTTPAFYALTREITYVAGLRARAGVASDRLLVYGTGGAAWGGLEQSFTTSNTVNTFVAAEDGGAVASDEMVWGYQAGAGVEMRFGARMALTAEYLYTSLDNRDESAIRVRGPAPATNPFILVNASGTDIRRTERLEFHGARAGLSIRF